MNFILVTNTSKPTFSPTPATLEPLFLLPSPEQINSFVSTLVGSAIIVFLLYVTLFYGLRLLFRRLDKEIGVITLNVSEVPLIVILIFFGIKISFQMLGATAIIRWIDKGLTALIVVVTTYWIAQLFTQVVAYFLKKYAQQTEVIWDDILIPLLETTIPVIVYVVGSFLFLQTLGINVTGIGVVLGGLTFVVGFAMQNILSNFFSGLVLLLDTPFQLGDVISLEDGRIAVIKKIGIRVTNLFMIDTHCELFIPNAVLESQKIENLSRPVPHYYYTIKLPLRADSELDKVKKIMREVVLAHPDTLGNIDEKLKLLNIYYKYDESMEFYEYRRIKKEAGQERLIAERNVNKQLVKIQESLEYFIEQIQMMEKGGWEEKEIRKIQVYYLDIVNMTGLEVVADRQGKRRLLWLEEAKALENTLIGLVRTWYKAWSKDPDLTEEDPYSLQEEWEKKIELLKLRMNKLYEEISYLRMDERKLDDYIMILIKWLNERFKNTQTLWQAPKVWGSNIISEGMAVGMVTTMDYIVKLYVDNIKLEQCQRGDRVKSEVQGEIIRQLKQVYLYR